MQNAPVQEAREFLRALRGRRSQTAFSRRIGFRSNVAAQWEGGRRMPSATQVMKAAQSVGVNVPQAFHQFHRGSALAVGIPLNQDYEVTTTLLAMWLREQKGNRSITDVAENCALSRTQVSRALTGRVNLRLPEFLQLVRVLTNRLPEFIGCFVDIEQVPSALRAFHRTSTARDLVRSNPWAAAVVTLLDTRDYWDSSLPDIEFLAGRLPLEREFLARSLEQLLFAGVLRTSKNKLVLDQPLTLDLAGASAQRLRTHWAEVAAERLKRAGAEDLFSYNLISLSTDDYERIRNLQIDFFRQVRSIVAESQPTECAALLCWHFIQWSASDSLPIEQTSKLAEPQAADSSPSPPVRSASAC